MNIKHYTWIVVTGKTHSVEWKILKIILSQKVKQSVLFAMSLYHRKLFHCKNFSGVPDNSELFSINLPRETHFDNGQPRITSNGQNNIYIPLSNFMQMPNNVDSSLCRTIINLSEGRLRRRSMNRKP